MEGEPVEREVVEVGVTEDTDKVEGGSETTIR